MVTVDEDAAGNRNLRAVLVADATPPDQAAMLAVLRDRLPDHMVPSRIDVVGALPRTASGKLDRRALTVPPRPRPPAPVAPTD